MEGYQGETRVDLATTKYRDFTPADWALFYLERYGQFDGDHHKAWTLDQIARALKGGVPEIREASWSNGEKELRFGSLPETPAYRAWVKEMLGSDENGDPEYDYAVGTPP